MDIQDYLHYLSKEKGLSAGSVNTYNSGLRFLYQVALDIPLNLSQIPCQRRCRKYPDLLTRQEIETMLSVCDNLRDRAMLATMYGAGLRISEVACLRVEDIDSAKMQLYVRDGKGGKDRFALLSQKNLELLRTYWKAYRPKDWMFYSRNAKSTGTHITVRGISNAFHKWSAAAGIQKQVTCHSLRHAFATHLLEDGVSIYHIKQLLGHADISTTCFYLHLIKISDLNVISPLDKLSGRA